MHDFLAYAKVGVHWLGPDGRILRANDEELRMYGYDTTEYVGHALEEFHEDAGVVRDILETLRTGRVLRDRLARVRCKDGQVKDVTINCTRRTAPDGTMHTRCFTLDVSDRVQSERTRALLAAVVESSEDAIVTKGLDGIITSWNGAAARLFGYSAAEAVGRHITLIVAPDRHDDERVILDSVGRGVAVPSFETERVHKSGTIIPVSLAVSPVRDDAGRVIGASKVARDISTRIALEAELREAGRRKDQFLATLAHELRNPLAPMRHALHLLTTGSPDAERVRHVHGILSRQLEHMVRLIDDLLDLSRINRDRLELRRMPTRLEGVVRQAVESVQPLLSASSQLLQVELPREPVVLDADPVRLAQVLTNLLSNASKFSNPGGHITLEAVRNDGMLQLRVADNGIGVPRENLERIFEMFAQGHDGVENSRGGLGIGLTLVRRIVELHGGTVRMASAGAGAGTTAIVELPLGSAVPTLRRPPEEPAVPPEAVRGRRILVVDDNQDSADTLAMLLSLRGSDVATVYDGTAALAAFAERPADMVLLDLGMPKISGFDVCRALRQMPGGDEAVVVALTGWGQLEDRRRTQEAGFDAHLVKPVELQALLDVLSAETRKRAVA
jgi:PAS domain S-box-containing protein